VPNRWGRWELKTVNVESFETSLVRLAAARENERKGWAHWQHPLELHFIFQPVASIALAGHVKVLAIVW
jgi:hypothetical protein